MYFSKPSKAITPTAEMLAQIERVTGTSMAAEDIAVFETTALNTKPLNKAGSIFNQATVTEDTMRQMAAALNSGAESVPLHTLHAQGYELPIGKVFQGEVIKTTDGAELRAMFYLPASETTMVEKINLGIIDEVSVGLKSKAMLCSKCGFDYLDADSSFEHFWDQTCANGHTIGVDGTHVVLSGMDKWMELSLVSRGAANQAKILGRTKQVMAKETYDRIAASGQIPEAVVLFTASDKKEIKSMDPETKAALDALGAQLAGLTELVNASLTPKEPTEAELAAAAAAEAEAAAALAAETSELAALKTELEEAKAERDALKAAAEATPPNTDANLTAGVPVGGVAASAITDAEKKAVGPSLASFKTPKR